MDTNIIKGYDNNKGGHIMAKSVIFKILNFVIYIICVLFSLSSFFRVLSFTPIEKIAFQNGMVMVIVFIVGVVVASVIAHFLYRVLLVLRLPLAEWKRHLLK